jgi:hypothetical protein
MSGSKACPGKPRNVAGSEHRHVVSNRYGNYSAFNGYRWTPSAYSEVACLDTGDRWRTKAASDAEDVMR